MDIEREAYKEEASELLLELEEGLIDLEESPEDRGAVDRVFRCMHTLKGSGAMFGFTEIAEFTHEIETLYDLVREGKLRITRELVDYTLAAKDLIREMVRENPVDPCVKEKVLAGFRSLLGEKKAFEETEENRKEMERNSEDEVLRGGEKQISRTYRIRFRPVPELFASGTNPVLLLEELGTLGFCHAVPHVDAIPPLEKMNPEHCYLYWDILLTTPEEINALRDVFIFVEDLCELKIDVVDEEDELELETEEDYKKLGEILLERGDVDMEALRKALSSQKRLGEILQETGFVSPHAVESALVEQQHVKEMRQKRRAENLNASVRVGADKLDTLVDLVGELVTIQARLSQKAGLDNDPDLLDIAENVEHLTAELRDNTMGLRMIPIGTTFNRFKRLVRDLSNELGKDVMLTTEGGETELDKIVIERLNDPLTHVIRNSIDHGIEPASVRAKTGKSPRGRVHLSAVHVGANVLIKIADDGGGLDAQAIRAKAVEKGFLAPQTELPENEIFALIFEPGFSTAREVSDVSGRGVGMDVVKRVVDSLRGSVEIESRRNEGTTIILKLPLTLAIIDGLLVRVEDTNFVFPLASVEECLELHQGDIQGSRHTIEVRGELVPFVRLRGLFEMRGERPKIEQIVVTEVEGNSIGFVVDEIVGKHQTVIKRLGKAYEKARCFSGATILADGRVALILDIQGLSQVALQEERKL